MVSKMVYTTILHAVRLMKFLSVRNGPSGAQKPQKKIKLIYKAASRVGPPGIIYRVGPPEKFFIYIPPSPATVQVYRII